MTLRATEPLFTLIIQSQFSHKSVNLFSILVIIKDKLTNLWGNRLFRHDFMNTFCAVKVSLVMTLRATEPLFTLIIQIQFPHTSVNLFSI
jgi:hypothetical protein